MDAINQVLFLVNNRCHKFCRINISTTHFQKMSVIVTENFIHNFLCIVNFSHGCNGKCAMMGTHNQWLWFKIGNAANPVISLHFLHVFIKFRPKWGIFYIVNCTVKPVLSIHRHSGTSCSQMGMIIGSKKQIKYAVILRCHSKKTAHDVLLVLYSLL